jgi:L-fuculose-phosphate aldolase
MYGFSGTVSARSSDDSFIITRGKVLRSDLSKADIVKDNGGDKGCCGLAWLHAEIYRRLPSVNAVIMARPPCLMAFAVTGKEINVRTIPESWILLQELPLLPPEALQPGRDEIFDRLTGGSPALLIKNDSVIVTGENLLQAFDRLEVAEATAMSLLLGHSLGSVESIRDNNIDELRRVSLSK